MNVYLVKSILIERSRALMYCAVLAVFACMSLLPQGGIGQTAEPLGKIVDLVKRKGDRFDLARQICENFKLPLQNQKCHVRQYAWQEDTGDPHPGLFHSFNLLLSAPLADTVILIVHDERQGIAFLTGRSGILTDALAVKYKDGSVSGSEPISADALRDRASKLNEQITWWQTMEKTIRQDKDVP